MKFLLLRHTTHNQNKKKWYFLENIIQCLKNSSIKPQSNGDENLEVSWWEFRLIFILFTGKQAETLIDSIQNLNRLKVDGESMRVSGQTFIHSNKLLSSLDWLALVLLCNWRGRPYFIFQIWRTWINSMYLHMTASVRYVRSQFVRKFEKH